MTDPLCPQCNALLPADAKFCPACGRNLKNALSTSVLTQVMIYGVSFFLAPFGLGFVFKYLKNDGKKERTIGFIALGLTIAAIGVMLWAGGAFMSYEMGLLKDVGL